jgi:hypothetical protein
MKKISYILITLFFLLSCNLGSKNYQKIKGKYINTFEPGASHYVILYDSLFIHYYDGKFGHFKQNGKLIKKIDNNGVEITFNYWLNFGQMKNNTCQNGCLKGVKLVDNELIFDNDERDKYNFVKIR